MGGVARADFGTGVGNAVRTLNALGNTPELIPNTTVALSRAVIHAVSIDCTANTGEDVYVRFYNHVAPTVGTTTANMVLKGYKGTVKTYTFRRYMTEAEEADIWNAAISAACVTEAGGGAGATGPSGTVNVTLIITKAT